MRRWGAVILAVFLAGPAAAEEVAVAVASNFLTTATRVAEAFEAETGHTVTLSNGATGLLYSQIVNGAPFDIFLAADDERPALLAEAGRASETRTYAVGQLALVSALPVTRDTAAEVFAGRTAALADPTVAPYGRAATTAMERLGLDTASFQPVMVANVGQVAAIFTTGNAELAFVATSQLGLIGAPYVLPLEGLAPEIRQDAALLSEDAAARAFWDWLAGPESAAILAADGYRVP